MKKKQRYLDYVLILLGTLLMLYYIGNAFISGFLSFSILFLFLGIGMVIYAGIERKKNEILFKKFPKYLQRTIIIVGSVCFLCFGIVEAGIIYFGQKQDTKSSDIVIILGAGLMGDSISSSLRYRLDAAIQYHTLHPQTPILVTGGQGYGETRTEASAMKEYLMLHGIAETLIICEDQSTNTYENFKFGKVVLEKENITVQTATVITNNFHMMRALYLGQLQGFDVSPYAANTYMPQILNDYVREFFACIKTFILYS